MVEHEISPLQNKILLVVKCVSNIYKHSVEIKNFLLYIKILREIIVGNVEVAKISSHFNRFYKITFLTIRFFFQFPHCANSKSRNYRRNTKNLHQNCILLSWTLSTKNRTSQKRSSNTLSNALCKNTTIFSTFNY